MAKLTPEQAAEIRRAYVPFHVTRKALAAQFKVHPSTIKQIHKNETWKEVAR